MKRRHLRAHAHPTESHHRVLVTPTEQAFAIAAMVPNFYGYSVLPRKYHTPAFSVKGSGMQNGTPNRRAASKEKVRKLFVA